MKAGSHYFREAMTDSRRLLFLRMAVALIVGLVLPLFWVPIGESVRPAVYGLVTLFVAINIAFVIYPGEVTRQRFFPYAWSATYIILVSLLVGLTGRVHSIYFILYFIPPFLALSIGKATPVGLFIMALTTTFYLLATRPAYGPDLAVVLYRLGAMVLFVFFLIRFKQWVERLLGEISALRKASLSGSTHDSLEDILKFLLGYLPKEGVTAFFLLPDEQDRYAVQAAVGLHTLIDSPVVSSGAGLVGQAIQQGRQIYVPNVQEDAHYNAVLPDTMSELVVPLFGEQEIVGVLNLESDRLNGFSSTHRRMVSALSPQIALTVRNIELMKRERKRLEATQRILDQVLATAHQLVSTAEELAASTAQVNAAMEEVAGAAQQVVHGADNQAEMTTLASKTLLALAITAQEISDNASSTETLLSETVGLSQSTEDAFSELLERAGEVRNISNLVRRLSDQTNLVSLNAAIEAARAGEQGKGFSVVADEVRELASISKDSAVRITAQIERMIAAINNLAPLAHKLRSSVSKSADHVAAIAEAVATQKDDSSQATIALEQVTQESRQHAVIAQDVGAIVEQVAASLNNIAETAEMMAELAVQLQQINNGA
ncbi:MAG: GAF domain-containing protein [Chloroflexi bacterium]|nr:GAF domain-containing protein [Chloroflexota bacterium]